MTTHDMPILFVGGLLDGAYAELNNPAESDTVAYYSEKRNLWSYYRIFRSKQSGTVAIAYDHTKSDAQGPHAEVIGFEAGYEPEWWRKAE